MSLRGGQKAEWFRHELAIEFVDERVSGVEPILVQFFDFRPRGNTAQMQPGFGVIGGVNAVAQQGTRDVKFGGVGDFVGDSLKRSAVDAQQYMGIRPDVQEPAANRARTGQRNLRGNQLNQISTVTTRTHLRRRLPVFRPVVVITPYPAGGDSWTAGSISALRIAPLRALRSSRLCFGSWAAGSAVMC